MATEAVESATGSEEPLITKVYLTDGKTQSTIAMTATDDPKDVEIAVGTDDDILLLPEPPANRDYDSDEEMMNIYPFDEPDEEYEFKVDAGEASASPTIESSPENPVLIPLADYDSKDTKDKDGTKDEQKMEDQVESVGSKPRPPPVAPKPTNQTPKEPNAEIDSLMAEDRGHHDDVADTKAAQNEDTSDSAKSKNGPSSLIEPFPPVDYQTETTNTEDKEQSPAVEHDNANIPPPPPLPMPLVQEVPLVDDQVQDHPLPPPPPPIVQPIVPPIDYADGKTVTFGGETVVGEGAGDGGSTTDLETASEASSQSATAEELSSPKLQPSRSRPPLTSEIELVAASFNGDVYPHSRKENPELLASPQSTCGSDGESIGLLEDESLISVDEIGTSGIGVTQL
nr:uncharacterized protein LOC129282277 [Lytechinus pictus]